MTHNPAEALREALGLGKKFDMEEALARAIFNDQHQGLQNCYDWDTAGLEDEHPGTTELYRGYAQSAIKTLAAALTSPAPAGGEVDALAQEIRRVDGSNSLGAGALAEALMPFLSRSASTPPPSPDVAGVVERLRAAAGLLPFSDLKSDLTLAERAMLLSAATLLESLSAEKGRLEAAARLRPMSDAPKNRTPVLLQVKASLPRDDLRRWEGLQFVGHHSGNWDDGFDPGWNMSAPVGHGGFPDEWFDGWRPLIARTALTPKEKA